MAQIARASLLPTALELLGSICGDSLSQFIRDLGSFFLGFALKIMIGRKDAPPAITNGHSRMYPSYYQRAQQNVFQLLHYQRAQLNVSQLQYYQRAQQNKIGATK